MYRCIIENTAGINVPVSTAIQKVYIGISDYFSGQFDSFCVSFSIQNLLSWPKKPYSEQSVITIATHITLHVLQSGAKQIKTIAEGKNDMSSS
jgi:hypothetical protein